MGGHESSVVTVESPFWFEDTHLEDMIADFIARGFDEIDERSYFDAIETKIRTIPSIKSCKIFRKKRFMWRTAKKAIIEIREFRDGYKVIKGFSSGGNETAYIGIRNKRGPNMYSLKASYDTDDSLGATIQTSFPLIGSRRFFDCRQFPTFDMSLRACRWIQEKRNGASLELRYLSTKPFLANNIKFTVKSPMSEDWMGIISTEVSRPVLIPMFGVLSTTATPSVVFSRKDPIFLTKFDSELTKMLNKYFIYRTGVETTIATGPIPVEFLHEPKKTIHMPFKTKNKCVTSLFHQLTFTLPIKLVKGLGVHTLVETGALAVPEQSIREIKPWVIAGAGVNICIKSARLEFNYIRPFITPEEFKPFQFGLYFD